MKISWQVSQSTKNMKHLLVCCHCVYSQDCMIIASFLRSWTFRHQLRHPWYQAKLKGLAWTTASILLEFKSCWEVLMPYWNLLFSYWAEAHSWNFQSFTAISPRVCNMPTTPWGLSCAVACDGGEDKGRTFDDQGHQRLQNSLILRFCADELHGLFGRVVMTGAWPMLSHPNSPSPSGSAKKILLGQPFK